MTDFTNTDTRSLVRRIADDMVARQEIPTAEKVRKEITVTSGGRMNPSATTVHDEMKKWFADTFWPTHGVLGTLPDQEGFPSELRRLYTEGFQRLVVDTMTLAQTRWDAERQDLQRQLAESLQAVSMQQAAHDVSKQALSAAQDALVAAGQNYDQVLKTLDVERTKQAQLQDDLAQARAETQALTQKQLDHERALSAARDSERSRADELIRQARADASAVKVELDAQRQAFKKAESALEKQLATISELTQRASRSESQLASAQDEIASLRERLSQAIAKLGSAKLAPESKHAPRVTLAPKNLPSAPRLRKNIAKR